MMGFGGTAIRPHGLLGLVVALVLSGCSYTAPKVPAEVRQDHPDTLPKSTITNFNEALVCMDDLMVIHEVPSLYLASQGIENLTSDRSLSAGGKEMLITALSKMSTRSKGVRFVSYGVDIRDILDLQGAHPDKADFRAPDFFIRGGVTQINKSLWSGQRGAGASLILNEGQLNDGGTFFILKGEEDLTGSYSLSSSYGTVTVDMSVGHVANLQIIPGIASSNTLAMKHQEGSAVSADLTIADFGFSYSLTDTETLDYNTVFRSLIQVAAIEIIGKLHDVPYWRCLANAGSVASRNSALRQHFTELSETEDRSALYTFVQQALKDARYYDGDVDGSFDVPTRTALQSYQQRHGLLATGLVDFETFRLMNLYAPSRDTPYVPWWDADLLTRPSASAGRASAGKG